MAEAWPTTPHVDQWRAETRLLRILARQRWSGAMRSRVNLAKLYLDALRVMPDTVDGLPPLPEPAICPVTIDDLLADAP